MIAKDWIILGGSRKERAWLCLHCGATIIERRWHRANETFGPMVAGPLSIGLHLKDDVVREAAA